MPEIQIRDTDRSITISVEKAEWLSDDFTKRLIQRLKEEQYGLTVRAGRLANAHDSQAIILMNKYNTLECVLNFIRYGQYGDEVVEPKDNNTENNNKE